ncbi:MAG TPA: aspartate aminotransferase family protein, partial [Planctomycetota bacterium]|nr:aspartate aminotransferase family protein [Planctomycetota bacterium]
NPLAVAAGLVQLRLLKSDPGLYRRLEARAAAMESALQHEEVTVNRVGSMMTVFFTRGPVFDWMSASRSKTAAFARFFKAMLRAGIYLPPSQFEAWFVSAAHTEADIYRTIRASQRFLKSL